MTTTHTSKHKSGSRRVSLNDLSDADRVVSALLLQLEAEEGRNNKRGDNEDNVAAANDAVEAWTVLSQRAKNPEAQCNDDHNKDKEETPAVAVATTTVQRLDGTTKTTMRATSLRRFPAW